jgi:DNA-directed RNA polymerase specialized sigma24 family protein
MKDNDKTDIGGSQEAFLTTHWSLIEDIKTDQDKDRALIGLLLERYWKPVYCYLRRKGHDNEQAKDLTQAFLHEVVLKRDLVRRADRTKGRFRSYLLYALNRYMTKQSLKENALKRIPKEKLVRLDLVEPPALPESFTNASAEECYHYAWLSALLERVLSDVKTECDRDGMQTHWVLFYERIAKPILENKPRPSLNLLCKDFNIEDTKKASNMIVTVKRRFQSVLMRHARSTVLSEDQAIEELDDLFKFFPEKAQHSF